MNGALYLKYLQAGGALRRHLLQPAPRVYPLCLPPLTGGSPPLFRRLPCQERPTSEMATSVILITGLLFPGGSFPF